MEDSKRINVVDSLRGFAVAGIIMIHFLEHLDFYNFPEPSAFEQGLWDTVFYLGSNKMYAIFAMLFGLTCYIQHHNQEKKGIDFRPRFAWRMVLLFGWGLIDVFFYKGDILGIYAIMGLFLIPLVKSSNRVLWMVIILLLAQPIDIFYIIRGIIDPSASPLAIDLSKYHNEMYQACLSGSILDVGIANLKGGLLTHLGWSLEHGRITQTLGLFALGLMIGRKRLFINEGNHLTIWKRICVFSLAAFAVLQTLDLVIPDSIASTSLSERVDMLFVAWRNLAMMAFYVSGITLLYYNTRLRSAIDHLNYIGKMSLSDYILQSIVGGFLFYNWGLGLYQYCSHGYSFILSIIFLIVLYFFCKYWTTHHRRGPLEEVWHKLTYIY